MTRASRSMARPVVHIAGKRIPCLGCAGRYHPGVRTQNDRHRDCWSTLSRANHGIGGEQNPMARAYLGVFALLFIAWSCGESRRRIRWRTVVGGLVLQLAGALLLIGSPGSNRALFWLNDAADALHRATETGTAFVFGYLAGPPLP